MQLQAVPRFRRLVRGVARRHKPGEHFGGGAFIASPLSVWLMGQFNTATHIGVAEAWMKETAAKQEVNKEAVA